MSYPERDNPQAQRERRHVAMAGLFKEYSDRICVTYGFPAVYHTELELHNRQKRKFIMWGAFGTGEEDKPEILIITSDDTDIRAVAKAKWRGDWPEVEDVDAIEGLKTIRGTVTGTERTTLGLSEVDVIEQDLDRDEFLEIINKLSLSLRFNNSSL